MSGKTMIWQVTLFGFHLSLASVYGQISYTIPEEMRKGSLVGNIAEDLGLGLKRLKSGNARLYTAQNAEYLELDREKGVLVIKEKIDRESLCGRTSPCAIHYQIIAENPMEFYEIVLEIKDINDNAPSFMKPEMFFEISELAHAGARYRLEQAVDPDIGVNGLQSYTLKPIDNFVLKQHTGTDGSNNVEMVLQKPLDREKQDHLSLLLTAMDGGDPPMSGTLQIHITVLDVNDNAPVFTQPIYKAVITENVAKGTILTTVSASDLDEGSNGKVMYFISSTVDKVSDLFQIDENSGEVRVIEQIDYEKGKHYQIDIEGKNYGGLHDACKLIIDVTDVNDNSPVINVMSASRSIPEDSPKNTAVAILTVKDPDSENNGKVHCLIQDNAPFSIVSTSNGFFSVVTGLPLDREKQFEYNISMLCADEGIPSLSSSAALNLQVSDVNDNAPVFDRRSYAAYIEENNAVGLSVLSVTATDVDWNQNSRISYLLEDETVNGLSVSSYVSVNLDSGDVRAMRSFDYEQIKDFQFRVKAQDGGTPPLSSVVAVKIFVRDQNDNAPQILYPVQTGSSLVAEMVPRSADAGYLVTKVVAVDVDSGQNAWLSYKLIKITDRQLFEVGLQNGEIRTVRQVTDKDAVKQRLTVAVEDNGQPPRSATVIVNVAVADSFPEVLSEYSDFTHAKDYNDDLTFYLILALAVVSFLFIVSIITILSVKCYRWRRDRMFYKSGNLPVIPYYPPIYADVDGTGTLQRVINYEVYGTTDSRTIERKNPGQLSESSVSLDCSGTQTIPHVWIDRHANEDDSNRVRFKCCNFSQSMISLFAEWFY